MSTSPWNGLASTVVPPHGFHYQQPLRDGTNFKIEAFSGWPELAKNVLRFRLEQISIVDPNRANEIAVAEDIHNYVCANFPGSCLSGGYRPTTAAPTAVSDGSSFQQFVPLIQRIGEWIGFLGDTGISFVPINESDRRAAICAKCRQNVRWEVSCGPCVTELNTNTTRILGSRKTRYDEELKGCRLMGWSNRIAVWLDLEKIDKAALPAHCWMKL
jgi:hypothetical protein